MLKKDMLLTSKNYVSQFTGKALKYFSINSFELSGPLASAPG